MGQTSYISQRRKETMAAVALDFEGGSEGLNVGNQETADACKYNESCLNFNQSWPEMERRN